MAPPGPPDEVHKSADGTTLVRYKDDWVKPNVRFALTTLYRGQENLKEAAYAVLKLFKDEASLIVPVGGSGEANCKDHVKTTLTCKYDSRVMMRMKFCQLGRRAARMSSGTQMRRSRQMRSRMMRPETSTSLHKGSELWPSLLV
jgi:hypothetical protein